MDHIKKQLPKDIFDPSAQHAGEKLAIIAQARTIQWNPTAALAAVNNSKGDKVGTALTNGVMSLCMYVTTKHPMFLKAADRFAQVAHSESNKES